MIFSCIEQQLGKLRILLLRGVDRKLSQGEVGVTNHIFQHMHIFWTQKSSLERLLASTFAHKKDVRATAT